MKFIKHFENWISLDLTDKQFIDKNRPNFELIIDEIDNISHILKDEFDYKIKINVVYNRYLKHFMEIVILEKIELNNNTGYLATTKILKTEECLEFEDRLDEICKKYGLVLYCPYNRHASSYFRIFRKDIYDSLVSSRASWKLNDDRIIKTIYKKEI